MRRHARLTCAALVSLAAMIVPAWAQDRPPGATQQPAPLATPGDGSSAPGGTPEPRDVEIKPDLESEGFAPPPGSGGCPLLNRKLELIV